MMKVLMTMIFAVLVSLPVWAQQERKFIRGGNDLFKDQEDRKSVV